MNYGIRVKNPLPKHVRVEVIDGKTIIRETVINPGSTKTLSHKAVFDPDHNEKWGLGLPQTQAPEPQKWEKNWQAKMEATSENRPPEFL